MISVVIPCRNGGHVIGGQLEALVRQRDDTDFEVVVSDNGSTDNTRQVVESFTDRLKVRVVDSFERAGRSHACNVGVRAAAGHAVIFADADDEMAPGYVRAMAQALERNDFVAAGLDCRTLNEQWQLRSCGPFQVDGLLDVFDFLPFAIGCSLGVSVAAFQEVGGFTDQVPFAEDVDFCWAMQLHGYPLTFVPEAVMRYRYRDTLWGLFRQTCGYGMGQAALFHRFRSVGMPARSVAHSLMEWYWLPRTVRLLESKAGAGLWLHMLGYRVGRLRGSLRYGSLYI